MKQNRWILEAAIAALVIMFVCSLCVMFLQSIQQENACWAAGYETPINYLGEVYCFGRDGQPEVMSLATIQENQEP